MTAAAERLVVRARPWSDGARLSGADTIAIAGGRVVAIGTARELESLADGATERIDAAGATVTPGITDAHIHLLAWARSLAELPLDHARSARACADLVARRAADSREPVLVGRGWDANGWSEPPHRALLDAVAPDRPVLLHSKDFHALWVNSAALAAAGVSRVTADPAGGRFERDAGGEPNGIVREHAVRAFASLVPPPEARATAASVAAAVRRLHAFGITAVHDFEAADAFHALSSLARSGGPRVRVLHHLHHAALDSALTLGLESGVGDDWFRVGGVKLFADGTLGSRTAALLAPYDGTSDRGMELMSRDVLIETVGRALRGGVAVAVHAIGDRAVRHVLDAFEAAGEALRRPALPSRIEHLQLAEPADVERLARLGVAASMQPIHCTADLDVADRWWRDRRGNAYAWRRVLAAGATLAFGSDAPVETPGVVAGLHAAVTRRRLDGTPAGGWVPEQRLSLDEALSCYTSTAARLAGGGSLGTLRPGSAADLVVWSHDLHALDPMELPHAYPTYTLLDGEVVYRHAEPGAVAAPGAALRSRDPQ